MAVLGSLETVRSQLAATPAFKVAFDYVARCLTEGTEEQMRILNVPVGETVRIDLTEGAFALEQAYQGKPYEEGRWEAHKAYIDVQVIIAGEELMELTEVSNLTVSEDFTPGRDLLFFGDYETGSVLWAESGFVAVFFPVDAHKPSLSTGVEGVVYKTVVKVPVGA